MPVTKENMNDLVTTFIENYNKGNFLVAYGAYASDVVICEDGKLTKGRQNALNAALQSVDPGKIMKCVTLETVLTSCDRGILVESFTVDYKDGQSESGTSVLFFRDNTSDNDVEIYREVTTIHTKGSRK